MTGHTPGLRRASEPGRDDAEASQAAVLRHRFRERRAAAGDEAGDQDRCDQQPDGDRDRALDIDP